MYPGKKYLARLGLWAQGPIAAYVDLPLWCKRTWIGSSQRASVGRCAGALLIQRTRSCRPRVTSVYPEAVQQVWKLQIRYRRPRRRAGCAIFPLTQGAGCAGFAEYHAVRVRQRNIIGRQRWIVVGQEGAPVDSIGGKHAITATDSSDGVIRGE